MWILSAFLNYRAKKLINFNIENKHNHKTFVHVSYLNKTSFLILMISVTLLSGYLYCPRKVYLERVLGLFEPPKEALVRGSIRHETYDLVNKNEENIVKSIKEKLSLEKIREKYQNEYLKFLRIAITNNKDRLSKFDLKPEQVFLQTYPLIMNEIDSRSEHIFKFIEKHNIFGTELWEKLTPKIISEIKIESKSLGIRGIIDQIEKYETGVVPVELKTGKTPNEGVWPSHKIQLAAYALLLEEHYDKEVKEGFVTYLDSKQRRHIAINAFLRLEVKELIKKVNGLLGSAAIPPIAANENKCRVCGLKDDCYNEKKLKKLSETVKKNVRNFPSGP